MEATTATTTLEKTAIDLPEEITQVDIKLPALPKTKRSLAECWTVYRTKLHTELSEDELVSMMQSCVDVISLLNQIDPNYYRIVIDAMIDPSGYGYSELERIAIGRCIEDYPKLPEMNK